MKTEIEQLVRSAVAVLQAEGVIPAGGENQIQVLHNKNPEHGEFASNIAMALAKTAGMAPRKLAELLVAKLPATGILRKTEIAGPGFINFYVSQAASSGIIADILQQGAAFGHSKKGAAQRMLIEFVSANPTGPLHVGHGRQAALGDALAALMETQGYQVSREFYYNDAGVQIENLALSVQARARGLKPGDPGWPEAAYNGEYIQDIARDFLAKKTVRAMDGEPVVANGKADDLVAIRKFAVTYLRNEQDIDLQKFGVRFDVYYLESSLYTEGRVEATVQALLKSGKTYEQDGALWLRTTEYGDDKDRVMRKSDGGYTYFVPDVAYHVTKWERGFAHAVNIQGTDHFGTVARVRAGLQALNIGIPKGYPDYVLHNMVKVMRNGTEVKISKRAGSYVTVRDLIDWVGRDAVRFFLVSRRADSEFVFDVDLALQQNNENPVYYVQYAHARICRVFGKLPERKFSYDKDMGLASLERLTEPEETELIKILARYPEILKQAAEGEEPHQLTYYLRELATNFHGYYDRHKILIEDPQLRNARLVLSEATQQIVRNGLNLLGVSAPEKMFREKSDSDE
ncbi:MAG TPA: arginine--tRNA ligase [Gammaproteobacteria bacterium]|nr:arginine--tRNA ligase [Gammaproteobacteria bacterium]